MWETSCYLSLKRDLEQWFIEIFQQASNEELGPFRKSPRFIQHEGDTHSYSTVDGTERLTEYQSFQAEIEIETSRLIEMPLDDVLQLLIDKGREFGKQEAAYHFAQIDKVIEEAGNKVEGAFTVEKVLEALEAVYINFDDHGNAQLPSIVIHPSQQEKIQEIARQLEGNEEARSRMNAIIESKRVAWHEEQNNRKLVD